MRADSLQNVFKKLRYKVLMRLGSKQALFTEFYKNNLWESSETVSGPGSELRFTQKIIQLLPAFLQKYNIRSMNDAPCGDFNFMKEINLSHIQYSGFDIVKDLVNEDKLKYAKSNIQFQHWDVIKNPLPKADLIFSRDMLIHFSFADAKKTIQNFKASGCQYLLTNTYPDVKENIDIKTGSFRPINLLIEPYSLDPPIDLIEEYRSDEHGAKQLALFRLN
jgi:hypothetical protein